MDSEKEHIILLQASGDSSQRTEPTNITMALAIDKDDDMRCAYCQYIALTLQRQLSPYTIGNT